MRTIWNPWHGCVKCSDGCANCYMYYLDRKRGLDGSVIRYNKSGFRYPIQKTRQGDYKVPSGETLVTCLTSDFFLAEADQWRDEAWDIIRRRSDVNFWIITKRPQRVMACLPDDWGDGWQNVSLSVTCENQRCADKRIPILLGLEDARTSIEDEATNAVLQAQGEVAVNENAVNEPAEDARTEQVAKAVKPSSSYFNTLAENEPEPRLIKAIIDENIKAVDGSRVRLRLLDDVEINGVVMPKGSYMYATMSGFGQQRVKGNVKSLLVDDDIVKVNLTLYDVDGLEGLYVPQSSFRETAKDVASGAMSGNMNLNNNTSNNTFTQWGMQAIQNAYQQTSNAISKAIRKNKVNLKYGTFVYLVNSRESKNK